MAPGVRSQSRYKASDDPREVHEDGPRVEVLEMTIVYRVPLESADVQGALEKLREDGWASLKKPSRVRLMNEGELSRGSR